MGNVQCLKEGSSLKANVLSADGESKYSCNCYELFFFIIIDCDFIQILSYFNCKYNICYEHPFVCISIDILKKIMPERNRTRAFFCQSCKIQVNNKFSVVC